jgi:DNA-binding LacI/PurR family transcriptional regulator
MADIARAAGCHQTTVSRALRGDTRIPSATRERIVELARQLGYQPHPLVSALIQSRRRRGNPAVVANIAYLTPSGSQSQLPGGAPLRQLFDAVQVRAGELGYCVFELSLAERGLDAASLRRILKVRGVRGVIIGPQAPPPDTIQSLWEHFPVIVVGYWLTNPPLYRVATNHHESTALGLRECRKLGFHRVGFSLAERDNLRTNGHEIGGFMSEQFSIPVGQRVPPLLMDRFSPLAIARWLRRCRPDAILTSKPARMQSCLANLGREVPRDIAIVGIGNDMPEFFARIERPYDELGSLAADVVVRLIHRNERGAPRNAADYLVNPRWIPGPSAPPLSA